MFCTRVFKTVFSTNSQESWGQGQSRGVSEPRLGLWSQLSSEVVLSIEPYTYKFGKFGGIFPENAPICQGKFG